MPLLDPDQAEPDLVDLTVQFLDALLSSASVDTIGVASWWDRATSALEAAAAGAESAGAAVTIAARKLQITTLAEGSAQTLAGIAPVLDRRWAEWTDLVARESVYLVALTRVHRAARRPAKPRSSR